MTNPENLPVYERLPDIGERCRLAVEGCLSFYEKKAGAYKGHVDISDENNVVYKAPNLATLVIGPALAGAYEEKIIGDINLDDHLLRPTDWLIKNCGTLLEDGAIGIHGDTKEELNCPWVKYTAELLKLEAAVIRILQQQTDDRAAENLQQATSLVKFLKTSADNNCSPIFDTSANEWKQQGWNTPGRVIEAIDAFSQVKNIPPDIQTDLEFCREKFGDELLRLWADKKAFLRDEVRDGKPISVFDSDIAASEIIGAIIMFQHLRSSAPQQANKFLNAAHDFASWLVRHQDTTGGYPLRVFKPGDEPTGDQSSDAAIKNRTEAGSAVNTSDIISPGDTANITIALIKLTEIEISTKWTEAILKSMKYCLATQCLDAASPAYGLPPSWRKVGDMEDPTKSTDGTYSGDQGGHLVRLFISFSESVKNYPLKSSQI